MRAIVQDEYGPYAQVLRATQIATRSPGQARSSFGCGQRRCTPTCGTPSPGFPTSCDSWAPDCQPRSNRYRARIWPGSRAGRPRRDAFRPGDRVFGEITTTNQWRNAGAFAEFAAVNEAYLEPIPDGMNDREAASVPTAALIALTNLRDQGQVREGQRVLVNGAGGGVGVWAVQLAKALGATVTAVDTSAKLDLLRELGADHVIDYTKQDFTRLGVRYDIVFDIVSQARFSEIREALEPDGTFVIIGHDQYGRSGHRVLGSLGRMLPLMAMSPFVKQIPGIRSGPSRAQNWETIVVCWPKIASTRWSTPHLLARRGGRGLGLLGLRRRRGPRGPTV